MNRLWAIAMIFLSCTGAVCGQTAVTATVNDSVVHNTHAQGQGGAISCIAAYGSCQVMKNAVQADNPGAEGLYAQVDFVVASPTGTVHGSPVSFTTNQFYIPVGGTAELTSRWVGASLYMGKYANGSIGCTDVVSLGGVTVNGSDNSEGTMTLTFNSGNCQSMSVGDIAVMSKTEIPANGTALPSSIAYVSGGATITYNTATPIDGAVSFEMNTLASGSFAQLSFPWDTDTSNIGFLLDGTFTLSFKTKLLSGPGTFSVSVSRANGSSVCSFGSSTFTATSTVQTLTGTCTDNEATSKPATGAVTLNFSGGSGSSQSDMLIDDVSFTKTSGQDSTNTTVFRDEFVDGLKTQFYANRSGAPLRLFPMYQNCETYSNWTATFFQATGCAANPAQTIANDRVQLQDYLGLVRLLGLKPYWHLPCSATQADAVSEYNFSMTYGFSEQDIAMCNEAWNTATGGQNVPGYSVYIPYAASIFKAIRSSGSYNAATTVLLYNNQYQSNFGFMTAVAAAASGGGGADGAEVSPYYGFPFSSNSTPEAMYRIGLSTSYIQIENSSALLAETVANLRSSNIWGASGTAAPKLFTYEQADGDTSPCGSTGYPTCQPMATALTDAQNLQLLNIGGANGVVAALESAELQKNGFSGTNLFAHTLFAQNSTQASTGAAGGLYQMYLWGDTVDCGGATASLNGLYCTPEPQMMGAQIGNFGIVGAIMADCTTTSPTYNQAAGPAPIYVPATSNVPYLYCYYYSDGGLNRGVVLVNTNTTTTYNVTLTGSTTAGSNYSGLRFAPSSFFDLNAAVAIVPTYTQIVADTHSTSATMATSTFTLGSGSPISVPPGVTSVTYSTATQYTVF